jgi:hypothetical protein
MKRLKEDNLENFLSDEWAALEIYQAIVEGLDDRLGSSAQLGDIQADLVSLKREIKDYLGTRNSRVGWFREGLGWLSKLGMRIGLAGMASELRNFEDLQRSVSGAYGTKVGWSFIKEMAEEAGDFQLARLASAALTYSERQYKRLENLTEVVGRETFLEEPSLYPISRFYRSEKYAK